MVTDPGVHEGLTNLEYHAETDWLSASQLKGLLPEHYKAPSSRDALDFGTVLHTAALGTDEEIAVCPYKSWRSEGAKDARAKADAAGAIPILADDYARVLDMAAALVAHPDAAQLLARPGMTEVSLFAEVDGQRCKARPDRLLVDDGLVVDLKTTSANPGKRNLTRSVIDFGYDLSAAHYLEVVPAALGAGDFEFVCIFVAKTPPHFVTVTHLAADTEHGSSLLDRGARLRDLALERYAGATDAYPGASGYLTLECPRWAELDETGVPA